MSPLTLILLALIAVFIVGLALLQRIRPAPRVVRESAPVRESTALREIVVSRAVLSEEQSVFAQAKIAMLDKKTELMQERLVRIENILAKLPVDRLQKEFDLEKLEAKVEHLIESRNDIRLELEALRERVESDQALDRVAKKVEQQEKQTHSFEDRLHALAFNANSRKKK